MSCACGCSYCCRPLEKKVSALSKKIEAVQRKKWNEQVKRILSEVE